MISRVSAALTFALCLAQPAWASAPVAGTPRAGTGQDYPDIAFVKGRCQFVAAGRIRPIKCNGVMYMNIAQTGRTSFAVMLDDNAWSFSGLRSERSDGLHFHLAVDSVVGPRDNSPRAPATGSCDVEMTDAVTVRSLICTADTAGGGLSLTASGKTKAMDLAPPAPRQAKLFDGK